MPQGCVRFLCVLFLVVSASSLAHSQVQPSSLVTKAVDESSLVKLHGSVHPLAQARYDRGAVPDALPASRVLIIAESPN